MVKIYFGGVETVDCTADPHPADFPDLREMHETIWRVVKDPIVRKIESVELVIEEDGQRTAYLTDDLSTLSFSDEKKLSGRKARESKTDGLYLRDDYEERVEMGDLNADKYRHLPNGLNGVRKAIDVLKEKLEEGNAPYGSLRIWVMWDFAGDISCSDYIDVQELNKPAADFSNQDWWIDKEGYHDHLARLSELVGTELRPCDS